MVADNNPTTTDAPPPYSAPGAPVHQKRRQTGSDSLSETYIKPQVGMAGQQRTPPPPTYSVPPSRAGRQQSPQNDDECPDYSADVQTYGGVYSLETAANTETCKYTVLLLLLFYLI